MNHDESLRSETPGDLGRPCETDSAVALPPPHTLLTFFETSRTFDTPRVSGGQPHRPELLPTHPSLACCPTPHSLPPGLFQRPVIRCQFTDSLHSLVLCRLASFARSRVTPATARTSGDVLGPVCNPARPMNLCGPPSLRVGCHGVCSLRPVGTHEMIILGRAKGLAGQL